MKKKLILFVLGILTILTLSSCGTSTQIITKISDEVEYTKIENDISKVYEQVSKGCIGIVVQGDSGLGAGSGVIYKYDQDKNVYYVVTNAHVVKDMKKVTVYFGGSKYNSASVLGYDDKNDIAVVTFSLDLMNTSLKKELYVNDIFNYEDNDLPSVGQTVLAIGCPLGIDNYNVLTTGVVSSVEKTTISTDTAMNPGNSGGGLFNLAGRLIGINTEKKVWTESSGEKIPVEGRGYAVSLYLVKRCITDIEKRKGIIERPMLGITVETINTLINHKEAYDKYLPVSDKYCFFMVTDFDLNKSAGKEAGLKIYDILLEIDGKEIEKTSDISDVLNVLLMDETIKLKVYRLENNNPTVKEITVSFS